MAELVYGPKFRLKQVYGPKFMAELFFTSIN
jgi:hypothetical protein